MNLLEMAQKVRDAAFDFQRKYKAELGSERAAQAAGQVGDLATVLVYFMLSGDRHIQAVPVAEPVGRDADPVPRSEPSLSQLQQAWALLQQGLLAVMGRGSDG